MGHEDQAARAPWARSVETHRLIKGRRWRVSDPRIPEDLRQTLVNELMAARRAVRDAEGDDDERAARARVQDAKVALGERGVCWWLAAPDPEAVAERIRCAHRAMSRSPLEETASLGEVVARITSEPQERVADVVRVT
jgi:hypothetical protein